MLYQTLTKTSLFMCPSTARQWWVVFFSRNIGITKIVSWGHGGEHLQMLFRVVSGSFVFHFSFPASILLRLNRFSQKAETIVPRSPLNNVLRHLGLLPPPASASTSSFPNSSVPFLHLGVLVLVVPSWTFYMTTQDYADTMLPLISVQWSCVCSALKI